MHKTLKGSYIPKQGFQPGHTGIVQRKVGQGDCQRKHRPQASDLDVIRAADQEARAFVRSYFHF